MLQLGYFEIAYNENNHLKITQSRTDVLFGRARALLVTIRREEAVQATKAVSYTHLDVYKRQYIRNSA